MRVGWEEREQLLLSEASFAREEMSRARDLYARDISTVYRLETAARTEVAQAEYVDSRATHAVGRLSEAESELSAELRDARGERDLIRTQLTAMRSEAESWSSHVRGEMNIASVNFNRVNVQSRWLEGRAEERANQTARTESEVNALQMAMAAEQERHRRDEEEPREQLRITDRQRQLNLKQQSELMKSELTDHMEQFKQLLRSEVQAAQPVGDTVDTWPSSRSASFVDRSGANVHGPCPGIWVGFLQHVPAASAARPSRRSRRRWRRPRGPR